MAKASKLLEIIENKFPELKKRASPLQLSKYGNNITVKANNTFSDDYPNYLGSDGERLSQTMDGHPISQDAYIVGRQVSGGENASLSGDQARGIAKQLNVSSVDANTGKNTHGAYRKTMDGDKFLREIKVSKKIKDGTKKGDENYDSVYLHEHGHAIDDLIGFGGITRAIQSDKKSYAEAMELYDELSNKFYGQKGPKVTPDDYGYPTKEHDFELTAEAMRLYQQNPGYIKEKYPNLAKTIRTTVNTSQNVKNKIVFNSALPLGVGISGYNALSPQQAVASTISPTNPLAPSPQMLANMPYNKDQLRAPVAPMLLDVADKMQGYSDWRDKNLPAPINWLLPFQPDPEYVRNRAYGREPTAWEKAKFGLSFL